MRSGRFRASVFVTALVLSSLAHVFYVVPVLLGPLFEKPDVPLEVAYVPDLTDDSGPAEPGTKPPPDEKLPAQKDKTQKPKLAKAPEPATVPPEVAKVEPPKPKPVPVPVKPAPPPKVVPMDHRMQMVDQQKFPDEADNKDAHYLAQKNHRAEKDTSAKNTNLIREVESPNQASSEPNQNQSHEIGAKEEKIAELENHQGTDLARSSPMRGEEGSAHDAERPGPLSMRNLTPRSAVESTPGQKAREGVELQEPGPGDLPMARVGHDGARGHAAQKGGKVKLTLDSHDFDNIEGFATAEKARRQAARAEGSHKKGRYDRYLASVQALKSSIENFTPEIRPGNQAELGTRASPFAGYITAMHRQIHKLFTFGFLADIDARSNSVYADLTLWTQLEIVIKGDGTVDKVGIVRSSGLLAFDTAAIDSVLSAAPFPVPPQAIRSANGKVYMDWQFHRDDRACGTFGVDPYILTTPGDSIHHDSSETGAQAKAMYQAAHGHAQAAPSIAPPRTLSREPPSEQVVRPPALQVVVPEVTTEVRSAAQGWFAAYVRGDARWLAGWSATPFTAAGEVVAPDAAKLKAMYRQLLAEAPAHRALQDFQVLTPAGIRGRLGGLPPGGEESHMLYAVGKAGGEEFILLLKKSNQGWRVCGIDR